MGTMQEHTNGFTHVSNDVISNNKISWKAKGIYSYLKMIQDVGLTCSISELMGNAKDGKEAVQSGIKELETYGYLKRTPVQDEDGRFIGYDYHVYNERRGRL
jgi:hypothetical protein